VEHQRGPGRDEVLVTAFALDAFTAERDALAALLDDEERARVARFLFDADRARFVLAHGLMRQALAACLAVPPATLRFDTSPRGKPFLRHPAADLRFNLSHSGGYALLAAAWAREVGIDIEAERPIDELRLAQRFFSQVEYTALAAAPDRRAAFFRAWARKESFVKARGDGLSFPRSGFDVRLDDAGDGLLLACTAAPADLARWNIRPVPVPVGYAAAVTAEGHDWRLVVQP
jgi:4'-phosphopantetheinyl transferase